MALLILALSAAAHAASPVTISPGDARVNLTPHLQWYLDTGGGLTFQDAVELHADGQFHPSREAHFSRAPRRAAIWIAITITNANSLENYVAEIGNPRMPEVDFFISRPQGGFHHSLAGTARPYYDREVVFINSSVGLSIPPGQDRMLFVRLGNTGDMRFQLWLWERGAFFNHAMSTVVFNVLMAGILLALVAFHFVVFLSIRELSYLYLTLFLTSWLLWYLAFTATGSMLLWFDAPVLAARSPTIFVFLVCATFAIFSNTLLDVPRFAPRWAYLLLGYAAACIAGIVFSVVFDSIWRVYFSIILASLGPFLMFGVALRILGTAGRSARFFLLTWCVVHVGGITLIILAAYFVAKQGFGASWLNAIVIASTLLWSFDLTGRVKGREREQRRLLEEQVGERTHELRKALSEVKQLSGLLPMCASCKKIRDDQGYWNSVEKFIGAHTDAVFSHGICPDCQQKLYPELDLDEEDL